MFDFFPDWDDIALAGAMAEELADRDRDYEERSIDGTDDDESL